MNVDTLSKTVSNSETRKKPISTSGGSASGTSSSPDSDLEDGLKINLDSGLHKSGDSKSNDDKTVTIAEGQGDIGGITNVRNDKQKDSDSSSDTSIDDLVISEKPVKNKAGSSAEDFTKSKKKRSPTSKQSSESENPLLTKLKRYVPIAGLHCVYKRLFEGLTTDKQRIKKLKAFFAEKGLEGNCVP
ncbi:unnamed protein product [Soboliphyme baturini]|uniref:DEK_C domain-containing protein n=1 Tax=Soboliphyme baturini TaxID=241478 RepID=A0A183I924_9BILA|nr:unnamed protein product [Soboliphyme baturini]